MAEPGPIDRPPSASPAGVPGPAGADDATATHGFLFADLRDYTAYVEARGNRAGAELLERYRLLVRSAVADLHGAEIKTEGDSFYVVFGSVSAAVRCGLVIVGAAASTATLPDPIRVGVGVHAGETIATAAGFVGSAVNIAARLCAEAGPGEVVVSDTVRALTRTAVEADFLPLGPRRLKGVAEPVACYRVVPRGAAAVRPARPAAGRRPSRRLAAGLAIALVALVAVGAPFLFGGSQVATPTPGPSAAAAASPAAASASAGASPGGSSPSSLPAPSPTFGPFPNEVEAAILAALPSTLAETCRRGGTADDARLAGFTGTVDGGPGAKVYGSSGGITCHPASGAARLYIMAPVLPSGYGVGLPNGSLPGYETLAWLLDSYKLLPGSCATQDRAAESWTGPRGSGTLACMNPYDGRPWIYFTFGDGRYLGFATRDDSDYAALYQWWEQLKIFLP